MACKLPRVRKCCFCISLRNGTLIIGYSNIVADLLWIIAAILCRLWINHSNIAIGVYEIYLVLIPFAVWIAILVFSVIHLFLSVLLVLGVHLDIPNLVLFYLIGTVIFIVLCLANTIYAPFVYQPINETNNNYYGPSFVIALYCILILYSTYFEMTEQAFPTENEQPSTATSTN